MRVVLYPYLNNLGHTVPSLAIAGGLRARGHEVLFRGTGRFGALVRDAGFEVRDAYTFSEAHNRAQMRFMRQWTEEVVERAVADERAAIEADQPDVVLGDFRPTLGVSARVANVPLAAVLCADWTNHYDFPPVVPQVMGMRLPIYDGGTAERFRQGIAHVLRAAARPLRSAYAAHGVPLGGDGNLYDTWLGDLNLLNDLPRFAPLKARPAGFHYTGPLSWPLDAPPVDDLPAGPLVYATLGTTGGTGDWAPLRLLADALGDWAGAVVLTTGHQAVDGDALPANLRVVPVADGDALAARASVVVCTGGSGSVYQSLTAGTPLVCLPRNPNQWYVAHRVRDAGVGRILTGDVDPASLRAAVEQVIESDEVNARARGFAAEIARLDPVGEAVRLIEAMA